MSQVLFKQVFTWVPPPPSDGLPTFSPLFRLSRCLEPHAQPSHEVVFLKMIIIFFSFCNDFLLIYYFLLLQHSKSSGRYRSFRGGSRLDWRLPLRLWAHGVSNMAAAAGEGSAVQELHCEHKAKAEGEGRDQAAAPPSPPSQKKWNHTHSIFGFNI